MTSSNDLIFTLGADDRPLNAAIKRAHASINRIGQGGGSATSPLQQLSITIGRTGTAATQAAANTNTLNRGIQNLGKSAQSVTSGLSSLGSGMAGLKAGAGALAGALGGVMAVLALKGFKEAADDAALMNARLQLAVKGWGDYGTAQADVARISRQTRSEITSTAVLYGKLAQTGSNLNATQGQVARATETVTKALKVSGAGMAETESAVLQLGQALSSGKLGGDEFSSLMESSPRLMKLFADSIGQPVGSLKKLASEGKLTSDLIFRALTDPKFTAALDEEAKALPKTFGDAFTAVGNLATVTFGEFDRGGSFSQSLFNFADQGSENMGTISKAAYDAGVEIHAAFSGLYDVFNPMLAGANSVFDLIGVRVYSLRDQISSLLGSIDQLRNIPRDLNNKAVAFDEKYLPSFLRKGERIERSNLAGDFNKGYDRSLITSARTDLVSAIRERDPKAELKRLNGMSNNDLIAYSKTLPPRKKGGTGNLIAPPSSDKGASKPDAEAKAAERRAERQNTFWQNLKDQETAAGMLAVQAERYNKVLELRKIVEREITEDEKTRITAALTEIENAKAITDLKQSALSAQNEYSNELQRGIGLTEAQRSVEDDLFKMRLASRERGVDVESVSYKSNEADLKTWLEKLRVLKDHNALLNKAGDFAKRYSNAFDMGTQLSEMEKQRSAFVEAWTESGGIIDGQVISKTLFDAIMSGYDQARAEIQNKPLMDALSTLSNSSVSAGADLEKIRAGQDFEAQKRALANSGMSPERMNQVLKEITRDYNDRMLRANRAVADDFSRVISDGISDFGRSFGGLLGEIADGFADLIDRISANANGTSGTARLFDRISGKLGEGFRAGNESMTKIGEGFKSLKDPLKGLKEGFSGKNGSFIKGIGQAVGGAIAGYQTGSMIGSGMSALGIKGSGTGAKIGGTIGGITGNPIIAAGASVIGGLIGSLFYKTPSSIARLSGQGSASIAGTSKDLRSSAGGAASSVQAGLANIAERLGGMVGAYDVLIGQYNGKWRVRDGTQDGWTGKVLDFKGQSKNGLNDFGDDAEGAIKYAIKNAISDGAIQGISDFAKKALTALDPDAAISLVESFKSITDELSSMSDPIGATVRNINSGLDSMIKQMKAVGASSDDLSKIEQYRSKKLDEVLKEQLSGLSEFLKTLRGDGSGVTALNRLNSDLAEFKKLQDRIAAGDAGVDQSVFTSLGQSIFGLARDVYGQSTDEFQSIRQMLTGATEGLSLNVTKAFNDATGGAVDSTTKMLASQTAMVTQQAIGNDLLKQLLEVQKSAQVTTTGGGSASYASNGVINNRMAVY